MQNAIIVHGKPGKEEYYDPQHPSASNSHWIPWLQNQLLIRDVFAVTPEMPLCFEPNYDVWRKEVERYEINNDTICVGHSRGAAFWLRFLSENKDKRAGGVILVAPSTVQLDSHDSDDNNFLKFEIDTSLINRVEKLTIFYSDNDMQRITDSVKEIRLKLPNANYREFKDYGHFTFGSMKTIEFPELLEECLG